MSNGKIPPGSPTPGATPTSPPGGGEADRNQPGQNRPGETDEQRREREKREREAAKDDDD